MAASNTVTWWELPVSDMTAAKAFYGAVFGWTFQSFGDTYEGVQAGDVLVGALSVDEDQARGVRVYVDVADLDETLRAVSAAGGATVTEPQEIGGDMGWSAAFTDPGGVWIGLWSQTAPKS